MSLRIVVVVTAAAVTGLLFGTPLVLAESTPSYTNADLERVQPYRNETGVASVPAFRPEQARAESKAPRGARGSSDDESYWRQEAQRVRTRQRTLDDQIERLRGTLDRPRSKARGRTEQTADDSPQRESLKRRIAVLEQRKRELESELDDRARRARVLPGWLR